MADTHRSSDTEDHDIGIGEVKEIARGQNGESRGFPLTHASSYSANGRLVNHGLMQQLRQMSVLGEMGAFAG